MNYLHTYNFWKQFSFPYVWNSGQYFYWILIHWGGQLFVCFCNHGGGGSSTSPPHGSSSFGSPCVSTLVHYANPTLTTFPLLAHSSPLPHYGECKVLVSTSLDTLPLSTCFAPAADAQHWHHSQVAWQLAASSCSALCTQYTSHGFQLLAVRKLKRVTWASEQEIPWVLQLEKAWKLGGKMRSQIKQGTWDNNSLTLTLTI